MRVIEIIEKNGFFIRKIELISEGVSHYINQYHYDTWPNDGVPSDLTSLEDLVEAMRLEEKSGKVIVHCSAGVGRTGTFITLSQVKSIIEHQKDINKDLGLSIFSIVRRLREQRMKMIQTLPQYSMVYNLASKWAIKQT